MNKKEIHAYTRKNSIALYQPIVIVERLYEDTRYLSDAKAELIILTTESKDGRGIMFKETLITFLIGKTVKRSFTIANCLFPSSWMTMKGQELFRFINDCYDDLAILAMIAATDEAKDEKAAKDLVGV